jgi:uncharacterized protein YodC (DUF2158 family)
MTDLRQDYRDVCAELHHWRERAVSAEAKLRSEQMAFNIGDQVQLNSGGPRMTVSFIGEAGIDTVWFNKDGDMRTGYFSGGTFVAAAPLPTPAPASAKKNK